MSSKGEEVKLLKSWASPFSNRVAVALEELGVAYDSQVEDMKNKSQELLEANPIHKMVPVLIHNGRPVCESLIILEYIVDTWSPPNSTPKSILPSDPYERSVARFWASFIDNKFWGAARGVLLSEGEDQAKAKVEFVDAFILMEGALEKLSGGKPYFGGDNFGYVDIALAPHISVFHSIETLGNFKLPLERCPRLAAWIELVSERQSVKKVLPEPERALQYFEAMRQDALNH